MRIAQDKFKKALIGSGGNQSTIAKRLGVGRSAVTMFLNKYPKMREILEAEAERIIDVAENVIDRAITKHRDIDVSKWKLTNSRRGKDRGYGKKIEQEFSGELKSDLQPIKITIVEDGTKSKGTSETDGSVEKTP